MVEQRVPEHADAPGKRARRRRAVARRVRIGAVALLTSMAIPPGWQLVPSSI